MLIMDFGGVLFTLMLLSSLTLDPARQVVGFGGVCNTGITKAPLAQRGLLVIQGDGISGIW